MTEQNHDPYDDDAMLPGEYVGLPGMTPDEVAAEKARWKAIAAELDRTRTGPRQTLGELLDALQHGHPGDELYERACRVFDWKD